MDYALAVVGSITTATRLKNIVVQNSKINISIIHTPSQINNGGCSYSLRFKNQYIPIVKKGAEKGRISVRGIFIEKIIVGGREYHAIS